jgi:phosphate transport system substrate-binding protein
MMKKYLLSCLAVILLGASSLSVAATTELTGAGSSFIFPVLTKWIHEYNQKSGIQINYQPIGSGGGMRQLQAGTVNFAASDEPLKTAVLNQRGWIQFPMITGGIVPIINVKGVTNNQLTLDGSTLAAIYLGKIRYWDNAAIKALNPGVTLPHRIIIAVHRADGSGTTFNFTNYLAKVSPQWKKQVGVNTVVSWPARGIGAKGNAGVASQVANLPGSIGYVEYAYAQENHLNAAKMKNQAGKVVTASLSSFESATANANWQASDSFYQILTNQPGANSWPIVATTFIMMPKSLKTDTRESLFTFFEWSYENSIKDAEQLNYVAIPATVTKTIINSWK